MSILLALTSVASAEDWSQFIEKPGDKLPGQKPAPPPAETTPAKQAKKPAAKQVASKQKVKARAKPKARRK